MSELSESRECVGFVERTDILEGSPADYWEQELRRLEGSSIRWERRSSSVGGCSHVPLSLLRHPESETGHLP